MFSGGLVVVRHNHGAFRGGGFGEHMAEESKKQSRSVTVVKGPKATGKVFGFRIAPKEKPNGGRIEIGDQPKRISLDTPEALKCNLAAAIDGHVVMGFLKRVDESA